MVETESDEILRDADKEDVALLVVGDPFGCVPVGTAAVHARRFQTFFVAARRPIPISFFAHARRKSPFASFTMRPS